MLFPLLFLHAIPPSAYISPSIYMPSPRISFSLSHLHFNSSPNLPLTLSHTLSHPCNLSHPSLSMHHYLLSPGPSHRVGVSRSHGTNVRSRQQPRSSQHRYFLRRRCRSRCRFILLVILVLFLIEYGYGSTFQPSRQKRDCGCGQP